MSAPLEGAVRAWGGRAALLAVALVAGWWLLNSPVLAFGSVTVDDYGGDDAPQLEAALRAAAREGNLLVLPRDELAAAAARFPQVGDVAVSRRWPRGLRVRVIPARPVAAIVSRSGPSVLVSSRGRIMGPAPRRHSLPRLLGTGKPPTPGSSVPAELRGPFAFVSELEPEVAARVRALRVGKGGRIEGSLTGLGDLIVGRPGRPVARSIALTSVLNDLSEGPDGEQSTALYVDISVPERPAVGFPIPVG